MTELDPKMFDVDAWLTGAKLPEHSVEVFGRADLIAKADELARRIAQAETDEGLDRSLGESEGSDALRAQYEHVASDFKASAMTIRVRALTTGETDAFTAKVKAGEIPEDDRPFHEIALASIEPKLTVDHVRMMGDKIGPQQVNKIWNAVFRATGEQPEVTPGFLPRRSGQGDGLE